MNKTFLVLANIVSVAILVSSMFLIGITTSQGEYDHWVDLNDDGFINAKDAIILGVSFGASGTPINKTELLLELLERIEVLENQSLPSGYMRPPAYDSGWVSISQDDAITFVHGLGTTEVFVYVLAQDPISFGIHHFNYGIDFYADQKAGGCWHSLDQNRITVVRFRDDIFWEQIRVQIWKIPEP